MSWHIIFFWGLAYAAMSIPLCPIEASTPENDFKKTIAAQLEKIEVAPDCEKGGDTKELALLYLQDQNQELAFRAFLKALDLTIGSKGPSDGDKAAYNKAFSMYLDSSSESPKVKAKKLINALVPMLADNPDEHLLDYFLALAYANLGVYEEFFKHFYVAYQYDPNHYLAYKTKAVLHIKLLERTGDEARRTSERLLIMENLKIALRLEPLDTTLYKLLISFAPKEMKKDQIQLSLNKIIDGNIIIPRGELMFYAIEAVDIQTFELAERFITRAKEWYPKSQIVSSAQNYLQAHK